MANLESLFDGTINPEFLNNTGPRNALVDDLPQFNQRLTASDFNSLVDDEDIKEIWEPTSASIANNIAAIRQELSLLGDSIINGNTDNNVEAIGDLQAFISHKFDELSSRLDKLAHRNDDLLDLSKTIVVAMAKQQSNVDELTRLVKSQLALSVSVSTAPASRQRAYSPPTSGYEGADETYD